MRRPRLQRSDAGFLGPNSPTQNLHFAAEKENHCDRHRTEEHQQFIWAIRQHLVDWCCNTNAALFKKRPLWASIDPEVICVTKVTCLDRSTLARSHAPAAPKKSTGLGLRRAKITGTPWKTLEEAGEYAFRLQTIEVPHPSGGGEMEGWGTSASRGGFTAALPCGRSLRVCGGTESITAAYRGALHPDAIVNLLNSGNCLGTVLGGTLHRTLRHATRERDLSIVNFHLDLRSVDLRMRRKVVADFLLNPLHPNACSPWVPALRTVRLEHPDPRRQTARSQKHRARIPCHEDDPGSLRRKSDPRPCDAAASSPR